MYILLYDVFNYLQARMQPFSKGCYIVVGGGKITSLIVYFNNSYAMDISS